MVCTKMGIVKRRDGSRTNHGADDAVVAVLKANVGNKEFLDELYQLTRRNYKGSTQLSFVLPELHRGKIVDRENRLQPQAILALRNALIKTRDGYRIQNSIRGTSKKPLAFHSFTS